MALEEIVPTYDIDAAQAEWDSPRRCQRLTEEYIHRGTVVLDIGIGTGQTVQGYQEKGALIIGVDNDQMMLDAAQAISGGAGDMRLGDVNTNLPLSDLAGKVDIVQAIGVLEFASDLPGVIYQLAATLKDDGIFVFTIEEAAKDTTEQSAQQVYPKTGITVYRHAADEVS